MIGHLLFLAQAEDLNDRICNLRTTSSEEQGRCQSVINISD
jgi:hypothetical protein